MLTLHPESDLSLSTVVLGTEVLKLLRKENPVFVEHLLTDFLKADNRRTPEMFSNVLLFLYAVGMVEEDCYRIKLIYSSISKEGNAS